MPSVAPLPDSYEARRAGTLLGGRYSLSRRIALGGMGAVWAATDTVLGRQVAVKILRDELVDAPNFLARFRAEARHTAALIHPGIASVFDYGEDQHGDRCVAYLVMELVPGTPLSAVMAERGTLPVDVALSLLAQTSRALHAAHSLDIVHRDVKPGNLLLLDDGTIKVTDFGIARAASGVALTEVGQVLGTASYMSPEQATGAEATPASDIYSLGVIGYEMLAGRPPFVADNPAALAMAHVHQPPPSLPSTVPAGVRAVIGEALSKNPADRPGDAQSFADRLDDLRAAGPVPIGASASRSGRSGADAPTMVMGYSDGTRTKVMPAHKIVDHGDVEPPIHNTGRGRRRWLAGAGLAAVIGVLALAQFGAVDGSDLSSPTSQTPVPASVPSTTVAPAITSTTVAPTTTAVVAVVAGPGNGKDHGKGHKPKG